FLVIVLCFWCYNKYRIGRFGVHVAAAAVQVQGRFGHAPEKDAEHYRKDGASQRERVKAQQGASHVRVQDSHAQHEVEEHATAAAAHVRRHVAANMMNSHPTVIGIASDRRNFLRPKVRDNPPAGRAPKRAPIRYMETTHDDCSMVSIINIFSPAVSGCSGAVQPPTTLMVGYNTIRDTSKREEREIINVEACDCDI
ncbi:hypothetical protein AGLY_008434, partial [Aphis glycines]